MLTHVMRSIIPVEFIDRNYQNEIIVMVFLGENFTKLMEIFHELLKYPRVEKDFSSLKWYVSIEKQKEGAAKSNEFAKNEYC